MRNVTLNENRFRLTRIEQDDQDSRSIKLRCVSRRSSRNIPMDARRTYTYTHARTHMHITYAPQRITSYRIESSKRVAHVLETDPRNVHPPRRWNASPPVHRCGFFPFLSLLPPSTLDTLLRSPVRFPHPLAALPSTRETRNALVRQRELPLTSLAT